LHPDWGRLIRIDGKKLTGLMRVPIRRGGRITNEDLYEKEIAGGTRRSSAEDSKREKQSPKDKKRVESTFLSELELTITITFEKGADGN